MKKKEEDYIYVNGHKLKVKDSGYYFVRALGWFVAMLGLGAIGVFLQDKLLPLIPEDSILHTLTSVIIFLPTFAVAGMFAINALQCTKEQTLEVKGALINFILKKEENQKQKEKTNKPK